MSYYQMKINPGSKTLHYWKILITIKKYYNVNSLSKCDYLVHFRKATGPAASHNSL